MLASRRYLYVGFMCHQSVEDDFFTVQPSLYKLRRQIDHRIERILIEIEHDDAGFLKEIIHSGIEIS